MCRSVLSCVTARGERAAWNGTPGLTVKDKKIAKQPQKPWSFPVASDRRSERLPTVLHYFKVHILWLRPANFPYVLSGLPLTARLALSKPTTNFIDPLRLRPTKATQPTCTSNFPVKWFLFHFQWFRRSPLAISETWHKEGDWAVSSSRKHEGNFFFFFGAPASLCWVSC